MVLAGDLEHGREGCGVGIDPKPYSVRNLPNVSVIWPSLDDSNCTDMLVDENDSNVFPLLSEPVEGSLDDIRFRLAVNHQEVLLRIGARRDVLLAM